MMNQIINRLKYWGQLLLLPIYWLSFFVPRDRKLWLFGSTFGRRFADNPRYLYLYVSQHSDKSSQTVKDSIRERKEQGHPFTEDRNCKDIRAVWISHSREIVGFLNRNGYEAYYYHSLKGIWLALRAKVYFFDNYSKDINFWQSGGAVKVNLWHGIPLKKIQADNIFDQIRHPKNIWEHWKSFPRRLSDEKPSHYVLTTSDFLIPIFSSAFGTENVLASGYPRNDRLLSDQIKNLLSDIEQKNRDRIERFLEDTASDTSAGKMVYYMPTFRDSETGFFDTVNLLEFQKFLKQNHILFCTKLHPKSKLKQEFTAISGENILVIDADTDPYVFLEMADVLVTDYSSIYFDFLLRDKPIVFFDYDLEEYLRDSREMYFDYEEFTPGEKAETMEGLEEALLRAFDPEGENSEKYAEFRGSVADKVFNNRIEMASPRLVDVVMQITRR